MSLHQRCAQTADEISGIEVLDFQVAQQLGRLAKEISNAASPQDAVPMLTKLCEACNESGAKAVLLNNLACAQKKCGDLLGAVTSLKAAVKAEGGMMRALPTTLVNMSAAMAAQGLFDEAAAVAHRAIAHCSRPSSSQSKIKGSSASRSLAAAYFNLAVALEGGGHTQQSLDAYHEVLRHVDDTDPYGVAATNARNNLMLDRKDDAAQSWTATVAPAIVRKTRATLPPLGAAGNRRGELVTVDHVDEGHHPRALSALDIREPRDTSKHRRSGTSLSNHRRHQNRTVLRGDISQLYAQPVQKYHYLPPMLQPISYEERAANIVQSEHEASKLSTSLIPASFADGMALEVDSPDWNPDPVLGPHSLSYRVPNPNEKKNWALIHQVEARFIPRSLVPLVEDMRYKESTRRAMIIKEWKRRFDVIRRARSLAATSGEQETARLNIEVEEARVRRVMRQWIAGKLLFAEAMIRLDKEETRSRDSIGKQAHQSAFSLQYAAFRLHPQAMEEVQRAAVVAEERSALSDITVSHYAASALLSSQASIRQTGSTLAYALALWCIEGVVPESHLHEIEVSSRKKSLAVLERFAVFGKQQRPDSE